MFLTNIIHIIANDIMYGESNMDGIGLVGVFVATPPASLKINGNKLSVTSDASQAEFQVTKTEYNDKVVRFNMFSITLNHYFGNVVFAIEKTVFLSCCKITLNK